MSASTDFDVGPTLPTLDAPRLRLRWLTEADIPALLAIFGDPETMRYWSHGPFADLGEAAKYLAKIRECFAERTLFQWGVELKATGGIIGTCTLADLSMAHRRAELGFALNRAHWRHGCMGEILPRLLRFAFDDLDLHRLTADADPRNAGSIALLERLGFRREGYLREHYQVQGETQDAVIFGLLRTEWRESRTEG